MNKRATLGAAILLASVYASSPANADGIGIGQYTSSAPTTSGARTLLAGGTSQLLFTTGEVQHGCTIQNPTTATEVIWVDFTGAAAVAAAGGTSIQVSIGGSIPCGFGVATSINWIAATTGHAIVAEKF